MTNSSRITQLSDTLHAQLFPSKKRRKARASKAVEEGAR